MQRYHVASCGGGVGNSTRGGVGPRDSARPEFSYPSPNATLSSRRSVQLTPYKAKCDREFLNSRLGPPDYYPPTPHCPEETLTRDAAQHGYKEQIEGIKEGEETLLSYTGQQCGDMWSKGLISGYKESIRKRLRAINDARVQKRKAGQVYGMPLAGQLLVKPALFPEQRTSSEDFKRKWIEGLSQPHKRLWALAEHVPHGYRRKALFEVLIKHNVPLLRATWFIKITYLNQVRPLSMGTSAGGSEKAYVKRVEHWTKDILEYTQCLLDEASQNDTTAPAYNKDRSPQTLFGSSVQQQNTDILQTGVGGEESTLQFRWLYMARLLHWHFVEGLVHRATVIEWVLKQFQERDSFEALEMLLPLVFEFVDAISLSQQHLRIFVETIIRWLRHLSPSGSVPKFNDHPQEAYNIIFLSEILRYLIIIVPDTFVSLDCFPLPSCVCSLDLKNCASSMMLYGSLIHLSSDDSLIGNARSGRAIGKQMHLQDSSIADMVHSIQLRASNISKAVNPRVLHINQGKTVQNLDKFLLSGDSKGAYNCIFEEALAEEIMPDEWLAGLSSCMRSSLRYLSTLDLSEIYGIFFLFEWATCDVRNFRGSVPFDRKVTGKRDISRIYLAISLISLKLEALQKKIMHDKGAVSSRGDYLVSNSANASLTSKDGRGSAALLSATTENYLKEYFVGSKASSVFLQCQWSLHDAVVVWLDQHDLCLGSLKRVQVLLMELIRAGIFNLHLYVRQLIISGTLDNKERISDVQRASWHRLILRQLPAPFVFQALEDMKIDFDFSLSEAFRVYSNERRFVLTGFLQKDASNLRERVEGSKHLLSTPMENTSNNFGENVSYKSSNSIRFKKRRSHKGKLKLINEIKLMISSLLHLPESFVGPSAKSASSKTSGLHGKLKRSTCLGGKIEKGEIAHSCEECGRNKKQRVSEGKGLFVNGISFSFGDDEETWWVKKGPKLPEAVRVEQPLKPTKQNVRGRQKTVRKTQSLAQLAATRIESSQGASSSHICDSKVHCPHHKTVSEADPSSRLKDGNKFQSASELHVIAKAMKDLRLVEKWYVASWLQHVVKQLVEGKEKPSIRPCQSSSHAEASGTISNASDERTSVRWRLTEDEMSSILYILDISMDFRSIIKFLVWILPKASPQVSLASHGGRSLPVFACNKDGDSCEVAESFILSCLRRYENILLASNLLPEVLSAAMSRVSSIMSAMPGVRTSWPTALYVRSLLRRYGDLSTVASWEKNFKVSFDQRLVAEFEAYKTGENETTYSFGGLTGASSEESDEHLRQKLSNAKLSRMATNMKDTVQRRINDAVSHIFCKDKEIPISSQNNVMDRRDDGYSNAQSTVRTLIDWLRQNFQNDAFALVGTVVSVIVNNVGQSAVNNMPDSPTPYSNSNAYLSLKCARQIIQLHVYCLRVLKEALGERQSRMLEVALAMEASNTIASAIFSGKVSRSQFQLSPETPELSSSVCNDTPKNSKGYFGKSAKVAAAVTSLVIGSVVNGLVSLERITTFLRIREGLDISHLLKCNRTSYNGISRGGGSVHPSKSDSSIELSLYWFRVLIGNCQTVFDGLVSDLLGEASVLAFTRMQHMMPLDIVFPPLYSIFSLVVWRHHLSCPNIAIREDNQLYNAFSLALADAIRHEPIREVCLKDTRVLYQHIIRDSCDSEFAGIVDMQGFDIQSKVKALVPLRGRLFLNCILDCQVSQDEGFWNHGHGDIKGPVSTGASLVNEIVLLLNKLHPTKFHWQWVQLRLLLNEQVLIERIENNRISAFDSMQGLALCGDSAQISESEKLFIDIVLSRLLVRPDAAAMYSEVVHLLGKSVEEYLISHVRRVLDGNDLFVGRKSLRQVLENIAQKRGLLTKIKYPSPRPAVTSQNETCMGDAERRKGEAGSPEEGELADDESNKDSKHSSYNFNNEIEVSRQNQYFTIEKGLADLVLPCLARISGESRHMFAISLVKQMSDIEQHVSMLSRNLGKTMQGTSCGSDVSGGKSHNSRKGLRAGSPGVGRRQPVTGEPSRVAAVQSSLWMKLQFLLPLLSTILVDRDSSRNMRHTLAPVLLSLLGSRVVQEPMDPFCMHREKNLITRKEHDCYAEVSAASASAIAGENLFDRILLIFQALLSSTWPSWLKPKVTMKPWKDVSAIDRELVEKMQIELDHMQLPSALRLRLQAAMPLLPPSSIPAISCVPPHISPLNIPVGQSGGNSSGTGIPQKSSGRGTSAMGKVKASMNQEPEEIDPWTLLEDGTASGVGANSGGHITGDHGNLKACSWLKGAVRVRRTDLTYIGALDDDTCFNVGY